MACLGRVKEKWIPLEENRGPHKQGWAWTWEMKPRALDGMGRGLGIACHWITGPEAQKSQHVHSPSVWQLCGLLAHGGDHSGECMSTRAASPCCPEQLQEEDEPCWVPWTKGTARGH